MMVTVEIGILILLRVILFIGILNKGPLIFLNSSNSTDAKNESINIDVVKFLEFILVLLSSLRSITLMLLV